ncbi:hypothetical protein PspLS_00959 [Pyricularia sp. CBS 133598]|nr:hypothetical protein PspLS_00959 [Pyricularia sp. CBS 133598]
MPLLGYGCMGCKKTKPIYNFRFRDASSQVAHFFCSGCHPADSDDSCVVVCPCVSTTASVCTCILDSESAEWRDMIHDVAIRYTK